MNKKTIHQEIERIAEWLKKKYKPEKIVLYGSFVWGEPTASSDVDFLVIKHTDRPFLERMREVYRLVNLLHSEVAFEPLVYTPQEIQNRLGLGDSFIKKILEKGEVLYDKEKKYKIS